MLLFIFTHSLQIIKVNAINYEPDDCCHLSAEPIAYPQYVQKSALKVDRSVIRHVVQK